MKKGTGGVSGKKLQRWFDEAVGHHRAGRTVEAVEGYRRVVEADAKHFDALHLGGLASLQLGQKEVAAEWLGAAVKINARVPTVLNNLGAALLDLDRPAEALTRFEQALALDARFADALVNRGVALKALGRLTEALERFSNLPAQAAENPDALYNQANTLQQLERSVEALAAFNELLKSRPRDAAALNGRALAYQSLGRHHEAVADFSIALQIEPNDAAVLNNRGVALLSLDRADDALVDFDAALKLNPDYHSALNNRGNALRSLRRLPAAIDSFDAAIRLNPDYVEAMNNRASALWELGRFDEAMANFDAALEKKPDYAEGYNNRANAFSELHRVDQALADFDKALEIKPDYAEARWNRSNALLLSGDYAQGWREYEWRWKTRRAKPLSSSPRRGPLWLGDESISGKVVLVHAEQGMGDTLQFCRYALVLATMGARVILKVPGPLIRLLRDQPGVAQVVSLDQADPAHDFYCPMMSLPLACRTSLQNIPGAESAYLYPPPGEVQKWAERIGSLPTHERPLRVGLVWNGGFRPDQPEVWSVNERRNIPLEIFARHLDIPGIDFFSLQKGDPAESEIRGRESQFWKAGKFVNFVGDLSDFAATAGLIANLDLVVSVDTSTAHLAAALGKPTWILNRFDTCWRWLLDREDSPWYDTVKLYRQGADRDWSAALRRLAADLTVLSREKRPEFSMPLAEQVDFAAADAHVALGEQLMRLGQFQKAIEAYEQAIRRRVDHYLALERRGDALRQIGRIADADLSADAARAARTHRAAVAGTAGEDLLRAGRYTAAYQRFSQAVAAKSDFVEGLWGRGTALIELHRQNEAIDDLSAALQLRPDIAALHLNRGAALLQLLRHEEAIKDLEAAIALQPDLAAAHVNLAQIRLVLGDYAGGWPEHEWRWKLPGIQISALRNSQAGLWDGSEPVADRTLVLAHEQGSGDTLQFCRYGRLAAQQGARVVMLLPAGLKRLLLEQEWVSMVVEAGEVLPPFHFHCPMMSLPLAFGTRLETIPFATEPYLSAPEGEVLHWKERLNASTSGKSRPRVGLVWNGGFRADQPELWALNERRNVPLAILAKHLDVEGFDFISLQKGNPAEAEIRGREAQFWKTGSLINLADELSDFAVTAGVIANLDLVISVDTSTAHLAAALGKPTWILNRYDSCWRWLLDRQDSPWYGSVKLYRQGADRDWAPVLQRVAADLVRHFA